MLGEILGTRFPAETIAEIRRVFPDQTVSEAIRKAVEESLERRKAKERKRLRK